MQIYVYIYIYILYNTYDSHTTIPSVKRPDRLPPERPLQERLHESSEVGGNDTAHVPGIRLGQRCSAIIYIYII